MGVPPVPTGATIVKEALLAGFRCARPDCSRVVSCNTTLSASWMLAHPT
jgi:hypothetical protein